MKVFYMYKGEKYLGMIIGVSYKENCIEGVNFVSIIDKNDNIIAVLLGTINKSEHGDDYIIQLKP